MLDYTRCPLDAPKDGSYALNADKTFRWRYDPLSLNCSLEFDVPSPFPGTVYMYIRLTNFYQNHRLYLTSLNVEQLQGKVYSSAADLNAFGETDCAWLTYANCQTAASKTWSTGNGLSYAQSNPDCLLPLENRSSVIVNANLNAQYYPCGLVANSMFSGATTCF